MKQSAICVPRGKAVKYTKKGMVIMKKIKQAAGNILYMFRYSWKIAKNGYFFLIVKTIITTVQPFALLIIPKYILDELSGEKRWNVTLLYVILLISILALFTLSGSLISYFEKIIVDKIKTKNNQIYESLWLHMDYGKLENSYMRDWGVNIQNNVDAWNFINGTVCGFITNLVQLIGYTYIIASLHPLLILVILAVIALSSILNKKSEKIRFDYQQVIARFSRRFNYLFDTMISFDYGKDIRINKASNWLIKRYERETDSYIHSFTINQKKNFQLGVLRAVIELFQMIVIYGYCAYKTIIGSITIGSFTVFLGAITAFSGSFTNFIAKCIQMKYVSYYAEEHRRFIREAKPANIENETVDISEFDSGKHEIEFINVSFKYPNTDNFVLKNINLVIHSGERLSIVGYNGAGKSTLIKLICRLYEPTEGKILYNGIDISTIHKSQYRELIAVVFQDFQIFSMSLRDNILLNRVKDETKIYDAIEKSGLSEKVSTLPKGIDTQIGREFDPDGLEFSGGEGQKLDCARAYYKDSPIVIMDEPTSALDPIAESHLYQRFNSIIGRKTAIYISHRLASVKFCDKIAVFVKGELVEYGTHTELMDKAGVYADMFSKQAEHYVSGAGGNYVETK